MLKYVLKIRNGIAIVLFKRGGRTEFVVCRPEEENAQIGDAITSWYGGHYFSSIDDALDYFNNRD